MVNVVVIASTEGGVIGRLLEVPYFKRRLRCVVSDRNCGAIDVAEKNGIPTKVHLTKDALEFSEYVLSEYRNDPPELFISFYTKLFRGGLIDFARNRLINMHPSILPACPGRDGFGDTIKSGSKFIGATIHMIDRGVDTGCPIIQSAAPLNPNESLGHNRHVVFMQQCKMLLQVIRWTEQGRIYFDGDGRALIKDCKYQVGEFAPNLDFDLCAEIFSENDLL